MLKILFSHPYPNIPSFAEKDLDILKEKYEVKELQVPSLKEVISDLKRFRLPLIKKLFALLKNIYWCDLSLSWSGKLNAFFSIMFAKLLHKRSIVIASGDDVANDMVNKKKYGVCSHPVKRWFAYFVFKSVDLVIAHSEFNMQEAIEYAKANHSRTTLIYHGFDYKKYYKRENINKTNMVATVGFLNEENYYLKGYKLIMEVAKKIPEIEFHFIGPFMDNAFSKIVNEKAPNVFFPGGVYGEKLVVYLSKVKVYLQLSEFESFGCALAEAMLCECIPVVLKKAAIPEVVGDLGLYVSEPTTEAVAEKIKEALAMPEGLGKRARVRIIELFPLEKRKKELLEVLQNLFNDR